MDDPQFDPLSMMPPAAPQVPAVAPLQPPQKTTAEKIAPLAVMAAALALGKNRGGGALAGGYAQAQIGHDQRAFNNDRILHEEALRQNQLQQQSLQQQAVLEQRREQQLMGAVSTIKAKLGTVTDKKVYDQQIDAYSAVMQQAGMRMTPNLLRTFVPFVAPDAKKIAGDAVSAWLKNPANVQAMKADPTLVSRAMLRIDTNGDGIAENVPLMRAGELGGIQFASDENGQALPIQGDAKIGDKFKELYGAKLARFVAENKRQPEPKEKETLIRAAIREGAEDQRKPEGADQGLMQVTETDPDTGEIVTSLVPKKAGEVSRKPGKEPNQAQYAAAGYAGRLEQSEAVISQLEKSIAGMNYVSYSVQNRLPAAGQSADFQSYDQAARNFVNAVLRRESGAVISPSEFENARKQYLPQPGDDPRTLVQKKANRAFVAKTMKSASGRAYEAPVNPAFESDAAILAARKARGRQP